MSQQVDLALYSVHLEWEYLTLPGQSQLNAFQQAVEEREQLAGSARQFVAAGR